MRRLKRSDKGGKAASKSGAGRKGRGGVPAVRSARDQAAAHRAAKGDSAFRARALLAKNNKAFKAVSANAKRNLKAKTPASTLKARTQTARAAVLANRSERLAKHAAPEKFRAPSAIHGRVISTRLGAKLSRS